MGKNGEGKRQEACNRDRLWIGDRVRSPNCMGATGKALVCVPFICVPFACVPLSIVSEATAILLAVFCISGPVREIVLNLRR